MFKPVFRSILYVSLTMMLACSPASKSSMGEVRPKQSQVSKKDKNKGYSRPQNERQKRAEQAQLSMIEHRIMFYKIRIKEAKKTKNTKQLDIYEMGLKKYQKQRREMTTLLERIERNLRSDY